MGWLQERFRSEPRRSLLDKITFVAASICLMLILGMYVRSPGSVSLLAISVWFFIVLGRIAEILSHDQKTLAFVLRSIFILGFFITLAWWLLSWLIGNT